VVFLIIQRGKNRKVVEKNLSQINERGTPGGLLE
jgi:hypothetical protein